MALPTDFYVDPTAGTDDTTGDRGSVVGNPWKSVQFAMDNITRNTSSGDRVNVKAGGTDTLSAALDFSTYGTPTGTALFVLQGYTSTQGDGGVGDIDGGGNSIISVAKNGTHFIDMELHNSAANLLISLGSFNSLIRCELHDSDAAGVVPSTGFLAVGCYFHDINDTAVKMTRGVTVFCHFKDGDTQQFDGGAAQPAVSCQADDVVAHNIFDLLGNSYGITTTTGANGVIILNNTIYHPGGGSTNSGILATATSSSCVLNNYIEGMAASGIALNSGHVVILGHNAAFNNGTNFNFNGDITLNLGNNTVLAASGLTDPSNGDFSPTTEAGMQSGGYLEELKALTTTAASIDVGAVQAVISTGGGFFRSGIPFGF